MIISFVGHSGVGKTTLLEKIIKIFSLKGFKVGTIKHTHHNFEIDIQGKDSYRHFHSGAAASLIVSDEKFALIKRQKNITVDELTNKYLSDCDIILVEGFKNDETPKIEVYRQEINKEPLYKSLKNVIAVASDTYFEDIKNIDINSAESIVNFIIGLINLDKNS